MTRRKYFETCMRLPLAWLEACAADPSPGMRRRHIALVLLAIRHKR
jgi:hypothetical protein